MKRVQMHSEAGAATYVLCVYVAVGQASSLGGIDIRISLPSLERGAKLSDALGGGSMSERIC